jgi:HSP20 family protein
MGFHRDDLDTFHGSPEELMEGYLRQLLGQRDDEAAAGEETDFPPLDIYEDSGIIVVEAELPGVKTENLEVSIASGMLVIEGLKEEIVESGRVNFLCMERSVGTFRRVIPLMQPVNASLIDARYRLGVLQIRIPKMAERRGARKVIPVKAE